MNCQNPLCGRGVLVDGCCLICGYGFKRARMPQRTAPKGRASKKQPRKRKKLEPQCRRTHERA